MGFLDKVLGKTAAQNLPNSGMQFVVIDVETTGLSPKSDRILEIALLEYTDGKISKEFVTRFNPEGPVGATEIHGITDADVVNSPKFIDYSNEILSFVDGKTIIAHNARFDLAFLRNELLYAGFEISWLPAICTFEASRYYFPNLDRRKLIDCCLEAEIVLSDAHSALGDAKATGALMQYYLTPTKHPKPRHEDVILIQNPARLEVKRVASKKFPERRHPVVRAAIQRAKEREKNEDLNQNYEALRNALKACSLSAVLNRPLDAGTETYLGKLFEFLDDGVLSDEERGSLKDLGSTYDLDEKKQLNAHEILLLALAFQAVQDETVSILERDELNALAQVLGLDEKASTKAVKEAKKIKDENISRILPPLPDGWKLGDPLRVGDKVVFTGCDPAIRDQLETDSKKVGVAISSSVSAKTRFLVTDGSYVGNKANEAKKLGTRIVSPEEYALLLKFIQPTIVVDSTKSKAKSSQSGAEDLDPAEVRAWAISKGIPVSPKGRIQADVYEAFRNREIRN